jgi:hypothetical protein
MTVDKVERAQRLDLLLQLDLKDWIARALSSTWILSSVLVNGF